MKLLLVIGLMALFGGIIVALDWYGRKQSEDDEDQEQK